MRGCIGVEWYCGFFRKGGVYGCVVLVCVCGVDFCVWVLVLVN